MPVAGVLALGGCSGGDLAGAMEALVGDQPSNGSPSVAPAPTASVSVSATAPVSGSPSPSATAPPAPTGSVAVLVPPDLAPATGYAYASAPDAVVKAFRPVAAGYSGVLSAPTVRAVQTGGTSVGTAAAMTVEPSHLEDDAVVNGMLTGLVRGMSSQGYTLRTRTVAVGGQQRKVVVAFRKGSTIAAWLHDGAVVAFITSRSESTALAYAKAYLAG